MKHGYIISNNQPITHKHLGTMPENTTDKQLETEYENAKRLLRTELFCTTRLEADKSLLVLSSAGVGLIVTLLTGDNLASMYELLLFLLGATFFGVCIFAVLAIFQGNAKYIQSPQSDGSSLVLLDKTAKATFALGIAFTAFAAVSVSVNNLTSNLKEQLKDEPRQIESKQAPQEHQFQGQLGRSERNTSQTSTQEHSEATSKSIRQERQRVKESNTMTNYNITDPQKEPIKKSWEGANNILDTPSSDDSSSSSDNDSSSSDSSEE